MPPPTWRPSSGIGGPRNSPKLSATGWFSGSSTRSAARTGCATEAPTRRTECTSIWEGWESSATSPSTSPSPHRLRVPVPAQGRRPGVVGSGVRPSHMALRPGPVRRGPGCEALPGGLGPWLSRRPPALKELFQFIEQLGDLVGGEPVRSDRPPALHEVAIAVGRFRGWIEVRGPPPGRAGLVAGFGSGFGADPSIGCGGWWSSSSARSQP